MEAWKNYWIFPAIMAFAVLCLFTVGFWDKMTPQEQNIENESAKETA